MVQDQLGGVLSAERGGCVRHVLGFDCRRCGGPGMEMCWLPPLGPAAPECWDSLGEWLQLLLCPSSRHRAQVQFPEAVFHRHRLSLRSLFPDRFLPSRRHECPGLPPALSSRSLQDADPSSPAAAPRPPATPHPQSGRGHLAGQGGGLAPRWGHLPEELPLEKAGVGRGGVLREVGMWSWAVLAPGGSQGGAELLLLSRQTQNRRS